jgi:acyl-coenzyme A synthetase/AMP-(fatty) acid ligase
MLGAPILMTAMLAYPGKKKLPHPVQMLTGGAPPPPALIQRLKDEIGVTARTGYGLTESYGPASTHLHDPEWNSKSLHAACLPQGRCLNRCCV